MNAKSITSVVLLVFVAVSIGYAMRKMGTGPSTNPTQTHDASGSGAVPAGLNARLTETRFTAVYFHAPHRCPTCRKIESFAHEALTADIKSGEIAWQIADYTAGPNAALVEQFEVFTSTVVLVEVQDGKVIRWRNLEEVWDHTSEQADFTAFITQAWSEFKAT